MLDVRIAYRYEKQHQSTVVVLEHYCIDNVVVVVIIIVKKGVARHGTAKKKGKSKEMLAFLFDTWTIDNLIVLSVFITQKDAQCRVIMIGKVQVAQQRRFHHFILQYLCVCILYQQGARDVSLLPTQNIDGATGSKARWPHRTDQEWYCTYY